MDIENTTTFLFFSSSEVEFCWIVMKFLEISGQQRILESYAVESGFQHFWWSYTLASLSSKGQRDTRMCLPIPWFRESRWRGNAYPCVKELETHAFLSFLPMFQFLGFCVLCSSKQKKHSECKICVQHK